MITSDLASHWAKVIIVGRLRGENELASKEGWLQWGFPAGYLMGFCHVPMGLQDLTVGSKRGFDIVLL